MREEWVRQIQARCLAEGVPFFFKQWGGVNKKKAGRLLDGRTWDGMPWEKPEAGLRLRPLSWLSPDLPQPAKSTAIKGGTVCPLELLL